MESRVMGNCHARFGAGENLEERICSLRLHIRPKDYLSLSYEMVAAAMEKKRLGLCSKTLVAVPNHLTGQFASEALKLYPNANILVTTQRDFEKTNRKRFCAKIATGNYDIVVIGHSQLKRFHFPMPEKPSLSVSKLTNWRCSWRAWTTATAV